MTDASSSRPFSRGLRKVRESVGTHKTAITVAVLVAVPVAWMAVRMLRRRGAAVHISDLPLTVWVDNAVSAATKSGAVVPLGIESITRVDDPIGMQFIISTPVARAVEGKQSSSASDAFARIDKALLIAPIGTGHNLVLNKFPVLPAHMVLVTNTFMPQDTGLSLADMHALWKVVREVDGLGFFNCGPKSGASQPRRHSQIIPRSSLRNTRQTVDSTDIPLEALISEYRNQKDWMVEPGAPFQVPGFDFMHAACINGGDVHHMTDARSAEVMYARYQALLAHVGVTKVSDVSHNFLLTKSWMFVVVRSALKWQSCNLNSLAYAGFMLVPQAELAAFIQETPVGVLRSVSHLK